MFTNLNFVIANYYILMSDDFYAVLLAVVWKKRGILQNMKVDTNNSSFLDIKFTHNCQKINLTIINLKTIAVTSWIIICNAVFSPHLGFCGISWKAAK